MKLLIVESPGKIKKLQSILGAEWRVAASCGHVRDLPNQGYGLEPPDFTLRYMETKPDVLKKLGALAKDADEVFSYLTRAVKEAGYEPGKDIVFAMDAAASELYNPDSGRC